MPAGFISRMEGLIGEAETKLLADAIEDDPSVSIRINKKKVKDVETFMKRFAEYGPSPVPWCKSGFYLERRPDFILDPLLHAGTYYVQEAASMAYEDLVENILKETEVSGRPILMADLCAAPGGKSTAILNALDMSHILVANEIDRKRALVLRENLDKWGDPDVIITCSPTAKFRELADLFDIVAVDAPCSGEGMMRREAVARTQWSTGLISQCSSLQREILENAVASLRPGGFLIYSTCTFNEVENEEITDWLISKYELELIKSDATGGNPRHFYPHRERCEGLYIAAFRKRENMEAKRYTVRDRDEMVRILNKAGVYIISSGTELSSRKGNLEIPSSRQVLSSNYDAGAFPPVNVSLEEARSYLRRQPLVLPADSPKGYVCIYYDGFPLGLAKNIGSRANNLYPSEWKIHI